MQTLKGRLLYMGWDNPPCKLVTESGDLDLWPILNQFFTSLNNKYAKHERTLNGYTLSMNELSGYRFEYAAGKRAALFKPEGGFSNVYAYINETLTWLSGRLVIIEIENGQQLKLVADPSEEVFGVYFVDDGNSCEVPNGAETSVCKAGQPDCCVFLTANGGGFRCEKFNNPMAVILLDRLAKGTMRANRIGNCAVLGRK